MDRKTIKISWETYKRLGDFAAEKGINLQEAADLLLNEEDEGNDSYVEVIQEFFPFENFESADKLREYLHQICELIKRYKTIQAMIPCSICKKPIAWTPDDPLGQSIRQKAVEEKWRHGDCKAG